MSFKENFRLNVIEVTKKAAIGIIAFDMIIIQVDMNNNMKDRMIVNKLKEKMNSGL